MFDQREALELPRGERLVLTYGRRIPELRSMDSQIGLTLAKNCPRMRVRFTCFDGAHLRLREHPEACCQLGDGVEQRSHGAETGS